MLDLIKKITSIKNKNTPLFQSIGLIVFLSFAISFISRFIEMKAPFHKKYCGENGELCPTTSILFVRFLHYLTTFFYSLYYFIFNERYDLIYLCLYVGLILHWLFMNDCVLSNWEMSYYDKEKRLGETGLLHPHLRVFVGDSTDYIIFFQIILMTMSFILVINRLKTSYYPYLFGATVLILQMYMVLKDRIEIAMGWSKTEHTKQHNMKENTKNNIQHNVKESKIHNTQEDTEENKPYGTEYNRIENRQYMEDDS